MDPFGFGLGAATGQPSASGTPRPSTQPGANPMFMDGYRHILEQLLGGIGQQPQPQEPQPNNNNIHNPFPPHIGPFQQQEAFRPAGQYQQQGHYQPPQPGASQQGGIYPGMGQGHILGGQPQAPQPVPQPQVPRNTRRFHYSMTTVGPDGRIHHISNDPESRPDVAGGRQIPVPTLNDFLGMHGQGNARGGGPNAGVEPGFEDPFGYHPLGMMLRQLMEGMAPIHGERGDYLPYV